AGSLAAIATLLAYTLALRAPGVTLAEARHTPLLVLPWIRLLVLSLLAAPLTPRRLALIWSMAGLFLVVLLLPATQRFFALDPPDDLVWLGPLRIAAHVSAFA